MRTSIIVWGFLSVMVFANAGDEKMTSKADDISLDCQATPGATCKFYRIPLDITFKNQSQREQNILLDCNNDLFSFKVFDDKRKELSCGIIRFQGASADGAKYIAVKPGESRREHIDLGTAACPRISIAGDVQVEVKYRNTRRGNNCFIGDIVAKPVAVAILPPDEKMRPNYISRQRALETAKASLAESLDAAKYDQSIESVLPPVVTLDEGIYEIRFPVVSKPGILRGSSLGEVRIDAQTGKILSIIGPED